MDGPDGTNQDTRTEDSVTGWISNLVHELTNGSEMGVSGPSVFSTNLRRSIIWCDEDDFGPIDYSRRRQTI